MSTDAIASLQQQLQATTDAAGRVQLLCELSEKILRENPPQAGNYAFEALELAEQTGDRYLIGMSYYWIASSYTYIGNADKTLEFLPKAKEIFEELQDQPMIHRCDLRTAMMFQRLGRPEAAEILDRCLRYFHDAGAAQEEAFIFMLLASEHNRHYKYGLAYECLYKSLEINQRIGNKLGVAMCYGQLSAFYNVQNLDMGKCIYYAEQARSIMSEIGDKRGEVNILTRLGRLYAQLEQFDEATVRLRQAEALTLASGTYDEDLYRGFVMLFSYINDWEQVLEYGFKALRLASERKNNVLIKSLYVDIGTAYTNMQESLLAIEYLNKALSVIDLDKDAIIAYNAYRNLSFVYEDMGNYEVAFKYQREANKYKDIFKDHEKQRTAAEMQAKFDVESAERERELFRVKNAELSAALDEVRRLNDNLTKLNNEKNEVLGIVAHDLKSPLSGVRMVASLLKEHYEKMPKEELAAQLDTIVDSTERMLLISSNLLKVQHIESGGTYGNATRVDAVAVVSGLVESYRLAAASKRIAIEFECEQAVELVCSEEALRQSIENLISNAVKFTPMEKQIRVRVRHNGKLVFIEVQDEGPGISKNDRRKLYGKYARLSARPTGGESTTGLGLWIAKRAVESMHGTIRCITGEDGTTFRVEVPLG